jgi:hypothetical protein
MGIFAPMDANEPKPDLYADCKGELLCFEGEINHLQFLSQIVCEAFQANPGAEEVSLANRIVPSCALGGVSSWDLETLSGYTLNPVFCYDNDGPDKGITGVEKASLFTNKHGDNLTVLAFTTPTKDADDFFRGGGNLKQFSELWRSARKLTVPLAVVRERIDEMRRSVKRKNGPMKYQVEQTIAEFVWKDLNERGRFFHSGGLGLIFLDGDKEPIEISGDGDKFCNLMIDYGLYPADQLKHFVGRFLGPQATRYGTKTDLHLLSYYDKQQNTVWLSEYDGNVLRITPQSIQRVPNGTDGVLFKLPEGAEPYKVNLANITGENLPMRYRYGLLLSSGSAIHRFITSTVQYQENNLTTVQYERLYLALLMTLFMPGLFHTKPLVMFLGESGSGKTMLGERAGWLLRGSKFAAVDMPEKKEDLENLITNTPFAVIDNVGKLKSTAFQSLLAIAATGGAATKRELYSTNKQVEYRMQANLWLSAITSPFKGDEMANRIVPFHTCKRDTYIAASEIKEKFMAHRDEMMTEVVARLQHILRALEATKGERIEVKHRMADFVAFVLRVAGHEGWRKDADYMFECMASDQEDYATEDDAVLETITSWLAHNESAIGRWHTPSQLDQEWRQQASTCGTAIPWEEGNTKALGWYVRGNMNILRKRLGLQVQRDKHSKANVYSFVPDGDAMEDMRAACRGGHVHNDRDKPLDDL